MDQIPKLPVTIGEIYDAYERDGTELVSTGSTYVCSVRQIVDGGYLKMRRTREKALAPSRVRNRNDADREAGRQKWDAIQHSMKEQGYDPSKPVEFRIKRINEKRKLHQGHHRVTIADELGIEEVTVVFHFRGDS